MGGHSTCFFRDEHGVAIGTPFYEVEGENHCVIRMLTLDN